MKAGKGLISQEKAKGQRTRHLVVSKNRYTGSDSIKEMMQRKFLVSSSKCPQNSIKQGSGTSTPHRPLSKLPLACKCCSRINHSKFSSN